MPEQCATALPGEAALHFLPRYECDSPVVTALYGDTALLGNACYNRGAPLSSEAPHFRRSRHVLLNPKTDLIPDEKSKTDMIPDEKSHGLGTQHTTREPCKKKWPIIYLFSDDSIINSRLRSPVIQKTLSPKKGIPLS